MEWFRSPHARFLATRWSMVLTAREAQGAEATQALERLCQSYWPPVYSHLRRRGLDSHDAEDLAQSFFAHLLARPFLENVSPEHGRFRTFLLAALEKFLINHWRHGRAQKRGGDGTVVVLEPDQVDRAGALTGQDTSSFDRAWAVVIVEGAFEQLKVECQRAGKTAMLEELQRYLLQGDEPADAPAIAARLGTTPEAVRQARSRLRRRFKELLMEAIAETVQAPSEVEAETRYLLRAWSNGVDE